MLIPLPIYSITQLNQDDDHFFSFLINHALRVPMWNEVLDVIWI